MTPEQSKLMCKVFMDTMKSESETTKKVIRAIPEDKKDYKPETKSMSANKLAWHIVTSETFLVNFVLDGTASMDQPPAAPPTIAAILEAYETSHRDAVNKLESLPPEKLSAIVPFFGIMEMPAVSYLNMMNL